MQVFSLESTFNWAKEESFALVKFMAQFRIELGELDSLKQGQANIRIA